MVEGQVFPPVILFGTEDLCWIGDGWHRVLAATSNVEDGNSDRKDIDADLRPGTRDDALKFALSANAIQGRRRTNADKRHCVEIAVKEFPDLSARAIAELCGVGHPLVASVRQLEDSSNCDTNTVTGRDGKTYNKGGKQSSLFVEDNPLSGGDLDIMELMSDAISPSNAEQENEIVQKPSVNVTKANIAEPSNAIEFAKMAIKDLEQITKKDAKRVEAFNLVKGWIHENE